MRGTTTTKTVVVVTTTKTVGDCDCDDCEYEYGADDDGCGAYAEYYGDGAHRQLSSASDSDSAQRGERRAEAPVSYIFPLKGLKNS